MPESISSHIPPYKYHITDSIIYTGDKKMMATIAVYGIPFECESRSVLNNHFRGVKEYLSGLVGGVYLWTTISKERVLLDDEYHFDNSFLSSFTDKYLSMFKGGDFFYVKYYITVGVSYSSVDDGIARLEDVVNQLVSVLKPFSPSLLRAKSDYKTEVGQYIYYLINNSHGDVSVCSSHISDLISDSEWLFGYDVLEIRNNESSGKQFATNYILKGFPSETEQGQWDFLLKLPYEFVITQSFIVESAGKTIKDLNAQENKLTSSKDSSEIDTEELAIGKEAVVRGDCRFGSYHCVMSVFGSSEGEAIRAGTSVASEFITGGKGFQFSRMNTAAPYAFLAHLPMQKKRPLDSRRTTTNLACTFSMHNYSTGKKTGNPIGDGSAIMPLKTVADGLYHFNTHYSDPDKDVRGQKIAGHCMILGATGTGKTTFEGVVCGFIQRFDPYMFVVDFNRSTELFVRAYGGSYFSLSEGVFTGLNPWQLAENDSSPIWNSLVSFLKEFSKSLVRNTQGEPCSDKQAIEVEKAVDGIMKMPVGARRTSALSQIVNDPELKVRLAKWCHSGAYGWATDSAKNTFNPMDYKKVGFDTTVILEKKNGQIHPACEPILAILFFYKNLMQRSGALMLSIIEEFWMPCNFPLTQEMIKSALKAGRLKNEMMLLTSQSPEDAINCDIFAALVQQTATKVFLPNPDAEFEGYRKIGLNEREFYKLKSLTKESRTMLIKQSGASAFAKMDLYGFDDFLPIISGTTEGIVLCEQIRNELGTDDPDVWIPIFIEKIKEIQ